MRTSSPIKWVLKLQSIQPIYFYPRKIASKIASIMGTEFLGDDDAAIEGVTRWERSYDDDIAIGDVCRLESVCLLTFFPVGNVQQQQRRGFFYVTRPSEWTNKPQCVALGRCKLVANDDDGSAPQQNAPTNDTIEIGTQLLLACDVVVDDDDNCCVDGYTNRLPALSAPLTMVAAVVIWLQPKQKHVHLGLCCSSLNINRRWKQGLVPVKSQRVDW